MTEEQLVALRGKATDPLDHIAQCIAVELLVAEVRRLQARLHVWEEYGADINEALHFLPEVGAEAALDRIAQVHRDDSRHATLHATDPRP